ncbi:MAG: hypothetical protein HY965_01135 [Ignavibacteriales bacterium]|nr:hypothetical protein [Ignavibacteriales bacterium]
MRTKKNKNILIVLLLFYFFLMNSQAILGYFFSLDITQTERIGQPVRTKQRFVHFISSHTHSVNNSNSPVKSERWGKDKNTPTARSLSGVSRIELLPDESAGIFLPEFIKCSLPGRAPPFIS